MSKELETVDSLNELLKGEYMAIESFNNFIPRLDCEEVKGCFQEVQNQHRENISNLVEYIQDIGGQPNENLGVVGKMADFMLDMDLGSDASDKEIINKAIEGETKGINMAEKVLRGSLDNESREVAGDILERDRQSIEKLKSLK